MNFGVDIPPGSILGLNWSGCHDSSLSAVAPDGEPLFACALERVSRVKNDGRFPSALLDGFDLSRFAACALPFYAREAIPEGPAGRTFHDLRHGAAAEPARHPPPTRRGPPRRPAAAEGVRGPPSLACRERLLSERLPRGHGPHLRRRDVQLSLVRRSLPGRGASPRPRRVLPGGDPRPDREPLRDRHRHPGLRPACVTRAKSPGWPPMAASRPAAAASSSLSSPTATRRWKPPAAG